MIVENELKTDWKKMQIQLIKNLFDFCTVFNELPLIQRELMKCIDKSQHE